jgi:hypothetical protein
MTEADIKHLLYKRYSPPQYAFMTNVANSTGWASRYADGVAFSLWPSSGFQIEGFEMKVSRSDFLSEMKHPEKSCDIMQYCDRWWLVAPKGVAHPDELPKTWGFYEIVGKKLFKRKPAPQNENKEEVSLNFIAAMLRRATEGSIPKDVLWREREDLQKSLKEESDAKVEGVNKELEKLRDGIKRFEDETGINMLGWEGGLKDPRKIGKAVKFVLDGGLYRMDWNLEKIEDALKSLTKELPVIQQIIKLKDANKKILEKAIQVEEKV